MLLNNVARQPRAAHGVVWRKSAGVCVVQGHFEGGRSNGIVSMPLAGQEQMLLPVYGYAMQGMAYPVHMQPGNPHLRYHPPAVPNFGPTLSLPNGRMYHQQQSLLPASAGKESCYPAGHLSRKVRVHEHKGKPVHQGVVVFDDDGDMQGWCISGQRLRAMGWREASQLKLRPRIF